MLARQQRSQSLSEVTTLSSIYTHTHTHTCRVRDREGENTESHSGGIYSDAFCLLASHSHCKAAFDRDLCLLVVLLIKMHFYCFLAGHTSPTPAFATPLPPLSTPSLSCCGFEYWVRESRVWEFGFFRWIFSRYASINIYAYIFLGSFLLCRHCRRLVKTVIRKINSAIK